MPETTTRTDVIYSGAGLSHRQLGIRRSFLSQAEPDAAAARQLPLWTLALANGELWRTTRRGTWKHIEARPVSLLGTGLALAALVVLTVIGIIAAGAAAGVVIALAVFLIGFLGSDRFTAFPVPVRADVRARWEEDRMPIRQLIADASDPRARFGQGHF